MPIPSTVSRVPSQVVLVAPQVIQYPEHVRYFHAASSNLFVHRPFYGQTVTVERGYILCEGDTEFFGVGACRSASQFPGTSKNRQGRIPSPGLGVNHPSGRDIPFLSHIIHRVEKAGFYRIGCGILCEDGFRSAHPQIAEGSYI